jgi:hypothetical protein
VTLEAATVFQKPGLRHVGVATAPPETVPDVALVPFEIDSSTAPVGGEAMRQRLQELGRIAEDYGLPEIAPKAESSFWQLYEIIAAVPELRLVLDQAFISLIFEAELQIEWGYPGRYLEIELRRDGSVRTFVELNGVTHSSRKLEPSQVIGALIWLGLDSA